MCSGMKAFCSMREEVGDRIGKGLQAISFSTRLLYGVFLKRNCGSECVDRLLRTPVVGEGRWDFESASHFYMDELSPRAERLLFRENEKMGKELGRLRLHQADGERWFHGVEIQLHEKRVPVRLESATGIELFVFDRGLAVLSLSLVAERIEAADALALNHALARRGNRGVSGAQFRRPHPSEHTGSWSRLESSRRLEIEREIQRNLAEQTPPGAGDGLGRRLGLVGQSFGLDELLKELVRPLDPEPDPAVQRFFATYSVLRLSAEVDFVIPEQRRAIAPLVSALAQVEEPLHAGAAGRLGIPNAVLNRKHWAAVSLQGAAHIVADQPGVPFNEERVARVRDKYFLAYLLALSQRSFVRRAADEAATSPRGDDLSRLRQGVLEFSLETSIPEVSFRSSVQRFYRLAQRGLDVSRNLQAVRRSIAQLDAWEVERRQTDAAIATARTLESTHRIHLSLEFLECVIIGFYAFELTHTLMEIAKPWGMEHRGFWAGLVRSDLNQGVVPVVVGLVCMAIALFFIRRRRLKPEGEGNAGSRTTAVIPGEET